MSSNTAFSSPHHQRAAENFKTALLELQQTIPKDTCSRISQITFPTFGHVDSVDDNAGKLEDALEQLIHARTEIAKKGGHRRKAKNAMIRFFQVSYPFTTLFLTVAKEASAV